MVQSVFQILTTLTEIKRTVQQLGSFNPWFIKRLGEPINLSLVPWLRFLRIVGDAYFDLSGLTGNFVREVDLTK